MARPRHLGFPPDRHLEDAKRDLDVAQRTARMAADDLAKGRCGEAFDHASMAVSNAVAAHVHATGAARSPAFEAKLRGVHDLAYKVQRLVKRRCLRRMPEP